MTGDTEMLWTYADVSELTRIKVGTLRKYVLTRRMPFVKLNGFVRFQPEAIRGWLEENAHRPIRPRKAERELFEGADA